MPITTWSCVLMLTDYSISFKLIGLLIIGAEDEL